MCLFTSPGAVFPEASVWILDKKGLIDQASRCVQHLFLKQQRQQQWLAGLLACCCFAQYRAARGHQLSGTSATAKQAAAIQQSLVCVLCCTVVRMHNAMVSHVACDESALLCAACLVHVQGWACAGL
jgi:hypothetical protein